MNIKILMLATALFTSGCVFPDTSLPPRPDYENHYVVYELAPVDEVDLCYEEPYWWEPDWCDYYNDGAVCCVWYIGHDYYEEWCRWDYHWCWEYNGHW
jgi:hypothetical protein